MYSCASPKLDLACQNIAQFISQYGTDGGDAVLGSVGAMVFLPGVDQRTANRFAPARNGDGSATEPE